MTGNWKLFIGYLIGFSLLLLVNELVFRKFRLSTENTRKLAHMLATLAVLPFPYLFSSHVPILVMAVIFFLLLLITQKKKQLQSIHAIERRSLGSYLLPASIYLTFLIALKLDDKFLFLMPMLILAISDPLAALAGMNLKSGEKKIRFFGMTSPKSYLGSAVFLCSSFLLTLIGINIYYGALDGNAIGKAAVIAVVGTLAEALSWRGSDNLSIPLVVLFTWLLIN